MSNLRFKQSWAKRDSWNKSVTLSIVIFPTQFHVIVSIKNNIGTTCASLWIYLYYCDNPKKLSKIIQYLLFVCLRFFFSCNLKEHRTNKIIPDFTPESWMSVSIDTASLTYEHLRRITITFLAFSFCQSWLQLKGILLDSIKRMSSKCQNLNLLHPFIALPSVRNLFPPTN